MMSIQEEVEQDVIDKGENQPIQVLRVSQGRDQQRLSQEDTVLKLYRSGEEPLILSSGLCTQGYICTYQINYEQM